MWHVNDKRVFELQAGALYVRETVKERFQLAVHGFKKSIAAEWSNDPVRCPILRGNRRSNDPISGGFDRGRPLGQIYPRRSKRRQAAHTKSNFSWHIHLHFIGNGNGSFIFREYLAQLAVLDRLGISGCSSTFNDSQLDYPVSERANCLGADHDNHVGAGADCHVLRLVENRIQARFWFLSSGFRTGELTLFYAFRTTLFEGAYEPFGMRNPRVSLEHINWNASVAWWQSDQLIQFGKKITQYLTVAALRSQARRAPKAILRDKMQLWLRLRLVQRMAPSGCPVNSRFSEVSRSTGDSCRFGQLVARSKFVAQLKMMQWPQQSRSNRANSRAPS